MAKDKKSFIAYCDWLETFEELTDEEAGKLVKHLLRYVNDQNPVTEDKLTKMCFIPIQQSLKRDLKKYEGYVQKQRENGAKGGRPKSGGLTDIDGNIVPKKSKHGHFIYLIYDKVRTLYKIGETKDLIQRRYDIKEPTSNLIVFCFGMADAFQCQKLESQILEEFREFSVGGDWFDFNDSHAYIIKKLISQKTQAFLEIPKKADSDSVSDSVNEFFNNKELDMVFCDFIEHREQIKAKMTPLAITKMTNKLLNYETGIAIKMLNKSIENGWKGVFELDEKESSISKNEAEEIDIAIIKNARDVQFNNNNTDVAENNRLRGLS